MKCGVFRIVCGIVLTVLQLIALIRGGDAFFERMNSVPYALGAFTFGIVGIALVFSGTIAYTTKKVHISDSPDSSISDSLNFVLCENCGANINGDIEICHVCGAKLRDNTKYSGARQDLAR